MVMDMNEAIKKILGERIHFKNGTMNITLKKVDEILPPDDIYDPRTRGHQCIAKGGIETKSGMTDGVVMKVYIYPHTEIFKKSIKIAGDKEKHTGATTSHTMLLGPLNMSEQGEFHYSTT